jgi:hypothetical protein
MRFAAQTIGRLAVAALVAVAVAAVGVSARPADAQTGSGVNAGGPYVGAVNVPITFTGSANLGVPIINYAWNFGDNTTGTGSIVQKTYTTAGTFTVTLTVTTNNGQTASATTTATVGAVPAGTAYSPYSPYGYGSTINPYVNTGVYNPYVYGGGVYPYGYSGYPCGVPVTIGGSTVTSACSGPFVNQGYPYIYGGFGTGCFTQPVYTQFGVSYRRICP